jgi:hypothetical protein
VTASAVYQQNFVFQGIRFEHRNPAGLFSIHMDTATIDPARLGYDAILYDGQNFYEPVKSAQPFYPNLYYGDSLVRRPPQQHYKAVLDTNTNSMRITPQAFAPRPATI